MRFTRNSGEKKGRSNFEFATHGNIISRGPAKCVLKYTDYKYTGYELNKINFLLKKC